MKQLNKGIKIITLILITVFILAYSLTVIIPHSHDCPNTDCTICNVAEKSRDLLLGAALASAFLQVTNFILTNRLSDLSILPVHKSTPIKLKVKLSN